MHNASFWRRYFESMFKSHLERTLQVLEQRLLPTFDGIEAEATTLQEKTYNGLTSMPIDPEVVDESMLVQTKERYRVFHTPCFTAVLASGINGRTSASVITASRNCDLQQLLQPARFKQAWRWFAPDN